MNTRFYTLAFLLPAVLVLSGCGAKKTAAAKVSGKVTLNGQPVTGGSMYFHSESGMYPATIDSQGNYELHDMAPGEVVVTIDNEFLDPSKKTPIYTGGSGSGQTKGPGGAGGRPGMPMSGPPVVPYKGKGMENSPAPEGMQTIKDGTYMKLPDLYKNRETTTIKFKIEPGSTTQNIEMTGK